MVKRYSFLRNKSRIRPFTLKLCYLQVVMFYAELNTAFSLFINHLSLSVAVWTNSKTIIPEMCVSCSVPTLFTTDHRFKSHSKSIIRIGIFVVFFQPSSSVFWNRPRSLSQHKPNAQQEQNVNRGVKSSKRNSQKNILFHPHMFQKLIFKNYPSLSSIGMELAYMMANCYIFKGLVFQTRCGQKFLSSPKTFSIVPGAHKTICTMSTGATCRG